MSPARDATPPSDADLRPRVLVVDDHPPNLLALEGILDPLGLDVVSATSGEQALMEVLKADFAVILMDVQMPGLDGFATTSLIKHRERSRHIPVIFLTAISRDAEHIFQGYAHGAVDYLLKPFDPEILRSKVRVFVDLWRQKQVIQRQERELRRREREAIELRSQARFRDVTDSMPGIVWATDAAGVVYYTNHAWRETVGEREGELSVLDLPAVHPEDAAPARDRWRRALVSGEPFEWQFRLARDGAHRWHLGRAAPERDDRGQVVGWIATGIDIDDRRRAEMVLASAARASERLARSLSLPATAEAVADLLVPELATVAAVQLLGDDGRTLMHEVVREAGDGALAERVRAAISRPIEDGQGRESVLPTSRPIDDDLDPSGCVTIPLEAKGRPLGTLWAARSRAQAPFAPEEVRAIEDLARRASTALENATLYDLAERERARAEDANRVKDRFLAMVSHELRTPLTSILGWAKMLLDGKVPPERRDAALETILRSVRTQAQLIDDLLDVSRITSGKLRLSLSTFALHEVIEAAIDVVRPSAVAKRIDLRADLDRDAGPVVADPDRLQQVVWNLLANAIKFSAAGGRISVTLGRVSDRVEISVADEGAGIPPSFLPYVFEPFRQAEGHGGGKAHAGGLGLGLAISKNLVELHGGTISAASEGEGRGARFVVSLPVDAAAGWTATPAAGPEN